MPLSIVVAPVFYANVPFVFLFIVIEFPAVQISYNPDVTLRKFFSKRGFQALK